MAKKRARCHSRSFCLRRVRGSGLRHPDQYSGRSFLGSDNA
jgi:hypothetical protein